MINVVKRHSVAYFWMALNLIANEFMDSSSLTMCYVIATGALVLCIVVALRELRFFCESPKLYRAYIRMSIHLGLLANCIFSVAIISFSFDSSCLPWFF